MEWHHSVHLREYFQKMNIPCEVVDIQKLHSKKYGIVDYLIKDADCIVIIFQAETKLRIIKQAENIRVISYNAETYYSPGCVNADYIIEAYPEQEAFHRKFSRESFDCVIKVGTVPIFVNPDRFDFTCTKLKEGIHFRGALETKLGDPGIESGGGHFRLYREVYNERKWFIDHSKLWVRYDGIEHNDFSTYISLCEATMHLPAYMSYFSKRPFECMAAGSINIFYVRDEYERKYLEELGFKHLENCMFVYKPEDCFYFYMLTEEQKEAMRKKAYELLLAEYTVEKSWKKILKIIGEP